MTKSPVIAPTMSLTARLVAGFAALLAVVAVLLAFAALAYGRAAARDAFDRLLVGAANDIAQSISIIDGRPVVDLPVSAFELLGLAADDRIAYQLRGPDGAVLTGYENLPLPQSPAGDQVLYDASFTGAPARFIQVTRRFAERSFSGSVYVVVGQTSMARNQLAYSITRNALGGLALGGLAMLVLAVFVVRRALHPLDELARRLGQRDPQDLTPLDAAVPREVYGAVLAMNGFMARLERQIRTMKRLISDSAHQLRTPVAALRAQADLAVHEDDATRQIALVGRFHAGTVRLSRLLDQMLSRAMVIHRGSTARREMLDLRDVALDLFEEESLRLIAPEAEMRLKIGESPILVEADLLSLEEAAKNLVGNALSHGQPPVTIGAGATDGEAMLWIEDAGPGPAPEVRSHIGERFNMGSAATGSSGLGMSIAAAVAEAYGGRLAMETRAEGFRISIILPLREVT